MVLFPADLIMAVGKYKENFTGTPFVVQSEILINPEVLTTDEQIKKKSFLFQSFSSLKPDMDLWRDFSQGEKKCSLFMNGR